MTREEVIQKLSTHVISANSIVHINGIAFPCFIDFDTTNKFMLIFRLNTEPICSIFYNKIETITFY